MSASFTNQVLAQIELHKNAEAYGKDVVVLPKHLDEKVARLHLAKFDAELTVLSKEQADYIGVGAKAHSTRNTTATRRRLSLRLRKAHRSPVGFFCVQTDTSGWRCAVSLEPLAVPREISLPAGSRYRACSVGAPNLITAVITFCRAVEHRGTSIKEPAIVAFATVHAVRAEALTVGAIAEATVVPHLAAIGTTGADNVSGDIFHRPRVFGGFGSRCVRMDVHPSSCCT